MEGNTARFFVLKFISFCKARLINDGPPLSSATSLQQNTTARFQQHLHTLEVVFIETDGFLAVDSEKRSA